MVRKLPDIISNEEACMVEPSAVSLHAVNLANVKVGDKVCIIGGGIIGLMAAEFAKMNGASYVCMVEANRNRGKKSLTYGYVDEYFNALNKDTIPNLVAMTNGFDVVIEACGNSAAVSEAMMLVKNGGTIVLVGVSMAPISVPMVMPVMGEVSMKGAIGYKEEEFDDVIELLRLRKLDVVKYIDDIIPIDAANSAFERLTNMDNDAIKIIFKPNN